MTFDANDLERMAKERQDECFLKGSGVLKLIDGIRQLEGQIRDADPALKQTIDQRDYYCEWADKLAGAIAEHLGVYIGEHTAGFDANNPWANALDHIDAAPRHSKNSRLLDEQIDGFIPTQWACVGVDPVWHRGQIYEIVRSALKAYGLNRA